MSRYLFFAEQAYAYAILRPLQAEMRRRGDEAAWWLEPTCPNRLLDGERLLTTLSEVKQWAPVAVFAPGNWVYDFFPGVKVQVFHGYPINKRNDRHDDHFTLRGWFDIYCTQGPASTLPFQTLAAQKGYFAVYETGWAKADTYFPADGNGGAETADGGQELGGKSDFTAWKNCDAPTILVGSTFSKGISALETLYPTIERLSRERDWRWVVTLHPKLTDPELHAKYRLLDEHRANVLFRPNGLSASGMLATDAMLCDSSSIIVEYMLLGKPVVTLRNTTAGPHLINVDTPEQVEQALEMALTQPPALMQAISDYTARMEAHRDGHNCARILDAVADFLAHRQQEMRRKPLNLFRRLKVRLHFLKHHKRK